MALILNIQRFSIHDGPGIRTCVFVKGCPLDCLWCHNPEGKSARRELFVTPSRCIGCGHCRTQCPGECHLWQNGQHTVLRERCLACGACERYCYGALELSGRERSVAEVMAEVLRDRVFYQASGGGLTVTGGDPMSCFPFTRELLAAAKAEGLHTCVETCGYAPFERFEEVLPLVDLFLYDYKESDPARHRADTGKDNALIMENLYRLDERGARLVLRCPLIPGYNDRPEHLAAIAAVANRCRNVTEIDLEPYHPLGSAKCASLGRPYPGETIASPSNETVDQWLAAVQAQTDVPVRLS